jgi:hypothetical protein
MKNLISPQRIIVPAAILLTLILAAQPVRATAPLTILTQPQDQTAFEGYNATFQVRVSGRTPPLTYAWMFNQSLLPLLSTGRLALINIQQTQQGDYFVIASDSAMSITSRVARLSVIAPATLNPKIGPNTLVGEARTNPASASRAQAEPHIARSPLDPTLVVTTFRESANFSLANTDMGWAQRTTSHELQVSFLHPKTSRDIEFGFEESAGLVHGEPISGVPAGEDPANPGPIWTTASFAFPVGEGPLMFFRLATKLIHQ